MPATATSDIVARLRAATPAIPDDPHEPIAVPASLLLLAADRLEAQRTAIYELSDGAW